MNSTNVTGIIATEPKQTTNATTFLLAVRRTYTSKDGQTADFFPVSAFGSIANIITSYSHKGSKLGVTGSIKTSKYMDKEGNERNGWELVAQEVFLLDSKPKTSSYTTAEVDNNMPTAVAKAKKYGAVARAKKADKVDPLVDYIKKEDKPKLVSTPLSKEDLNSLIAQLTNANA